MLFARKPPQPFLHQDTFLHPNRTPSLNNSKHRALADPCRLGILPGSSWNKKKELPLNPEFKR
jgi:hypothetical protein